MAALLIGFVLGWIQSSRVSEHRLDRVIAVKWGDGKYGPAFYGARVFLQPTSGGYSVQARVYIGHGGDYFHDCGELGIALTPADAVAHWGTIDWREDGVHIGTGPTQYFLPRATVESHR